MKKIIFISLFIGLICLFVGYASGRGYKTYEVNIEKQKEAQAKQEMENHMAHEMKMPEKELTNPKYLPAKIISLTPTKDMDGGYSLKIDTQYFRFTPEMVGKQVVPNTGHAHVFVNGVKVGRAYSPWFFIPASFFKSGTSTISVTLNANNHNVWWNKDGTIEASSSVEVFQ
jgi:hypothetical protein